MSTSTQTFDAGRLMAVLVSPIVSEKATFVAEKHNTVTFKVLQSASKPEIKAAVEAQFDGTKVASIKTLVQNGKAVRYSRGKNRYPGTTSRKDTKKAYVTLSEGKIKVFETEEVKEEKADKKPAKKEEKK